MTYRLSFLVRLGVFAHVFARPGIMFLLWPTNMRNLIARLGSLLKASIMKNDANGAETMREKCIARDYAGPAFLWVNGDEDRQGLLHRLREQLHVAEAVILALVCLPFLAPQATKDSDPLYQAAHPLV